MGHETNDSLKKPFPVHKARANREEADHQNCGGKNDMRVGLRPEIDAGNPGFWRQIVVRFRHHQAIMPSASDSGFA
jgi:hypothetical protein